MKYRIVDGPKREEVARLLFLDRLGGVKEEERAADFVLSANDTDADTKRVPCIISSVRREPGGDSCYRMEGLTLDSRIVAIKLYYDFSGLEVWGDLEIGD